MRGNLLKKEIIFGIIILMISTSLMPVFAGNDTRSSNEQKITSTPVPTPEKTTTMTFYIFEKTKVEKHISIVSTQDAVQINACFQELKKALAAHPYDERTRPLVQEFITLLEEKHALPTGISTQELTTLLQAPETPTHPLVNGILPLGITSSEWFCNFATTGTGSAFPIIILPRIIPFILTPIPRIFVLWSTPDGITSVGGLVSHKGFIAGGQQRGLALGFWGIGFSIFLPPIDQYGIFGYALFARVTADSMEFWPPNNPPEITQTDPVDGQTMVPLSTKELRFSISDADTKDLMSYTVTTDPDIGSGSGGLKPNGIYSIPISGLESFTNYTWHISVTDGKDTTEKTQTFTTEMAAPIISNPSPGNDEREVPTTITTLHFHLKDYQGDAMEYTVETLPNIGSDHKAGVHDGTFNVAISGLASGTVYRWYVNATDGTYWARKVYQFSTGYPSPFDPFAYGWHYRKQITVDHTQVSEDLQDFTVLLSTIDPDLTKAQATGNDILFMDNVGAAVKIHHEVESFDASTGTLIAWVNIPVLSSTQDTVFYMYYGNPSSIDQSYPQKTWDPHYQAVWHMNDATSSTIFDSTANEYKGTKVGPNEPAQETGQIGESQHFDGSNDYIQYTNPVIPLGVKTISAWFKCQGTSDFQVVFSSSTGVSSSDAGTGWTVTNENPNTLGCYIGNGQTSGHFMEIYTTIPDATDWHFYTMTYDGSTLTIYRDGMLAASSTTQSGSEAPPDHNLRMGRSNHQSYPYPMKGGLDELRIADVAFSEGYIATQYTNQYNPSGFSTIGPEVPGP